MASSFAFIVRYSFFQSFFVGEIMNNIKEEIKEFTKLIKKYSDIEDLYIGRAILYTKIKQYKKAVEDYERGCKKYLCYDMMNICKRNNLIKEAEELYTKTINKDKNNIINYISRARFYMSIGEDEKALADCEIIIKLYPENDFILELKKVLTKKLNVHKKHTQKTKIKPVFE